MTRRRRLLGHALAAATLALVLPAHTPYRQWVVYRKRNLLLGCHRQDEAAYPQAKAIEAGLHRTLPEARARVARAPHPERLASLLATDQLELVLLRPAEAEGMREAHPPFAAYGAVPLRAACSVGDHVLYAVPDFDTNHLHLLLDALAHADAGLAIGRATADAGPLHPAAEDWFGDHD